MQPTYLPWAGYFQMLAVSDFFVFLDDVKFNHQSWQSRNYILLSGQKHLLSVPVGKLFQKKNIGEVVTDPKARWRRKHWMTLVHAYGKAPFGSEVLDLIGPHIRENEQNFLSDFNIRIIETLAHALGIERKFYRSGYFCNPHDRTERILNILKVLNASRYLSPLGSATYLAGDKFHQRFWGKTYFHFAESWQYPQINSRTFVPRLSIIDMIANIGLASTTEYLMESSVRTFRLEV